MNSKEMTDKENKLAIEEALLRNKQKILLESYHKKRSLLNFFLLNLLCMVVFLALMLYAQFVLSHDLDSSLFLAAFNIGIMIFIGILILMILRTQKEMEIKKQDLNNELVIDIET